MAQKFNILDEVVDMELQKKYLEYSHSFGLGELSEEDTKYLAEVLFDDQAPLFSKRKALTLLAHLGSVTAYRQIEKYYKSAEGRDKQWAALALNECKMFLENALTDDEIVFIAGGLGGYKDMMRYYFMILPLPGVQFTLDQMDRVAEITPTIAKDMNCIVESFKSSEKYIGFLALIPLDVATGNFIDEVIRQCNTIEEFVFEHYYVTNMNVPEDKEIEEIIDKVRNG